MLSIAEIISTLHERNISHRDIKIENILTIDEKIFLADFGLAKFPEKQSLTGENEAVGAKWTIAPEMKRSSKISDGKMADVYSLAKTFWVILTENNKGFEGQYSPNGFHGLTKLLPKEKDEFHLKGEKSIYIGLLDKVIEISTNSDPLERPTIFSFIKILNEWLESYDKFEKHNPLEWGEVCKKIFPFIIPNEARYTDINAMKTILDILGSIESLNHMFFPNGGGMDLQGVKSGENNSEIRLICGAEYEICVKPISITFGNFTDSLEWNYFRLEALVSKSFFDTGFFSGSPDSSETISKSFLIVSKTSFYNKISSAYDARHDKLTQIEFHSYVLELVKLSQQIKDEIKEQESLEGEETESQFDLGDFGNFFSRKVVDSIKWETFKKR